VKYAYDTCPRRSAPRTRRATTPRASWYSASGLALRQSTSFRGGTLRYLHVSEFGKICAKFPHKAREIVTGAFEAVAADCFVTIESTAEGRAGTSSTTAQSAEKQQLSGVPSGPAGLEVLLLQLVAKPALLAGSSRVTIPQRLTEYFRRAERKHGIVTNPGQRAWYAPRKRPSATT
jgi:hypothetical protein